MSTSLFAAELLPTLRRACHAAICRDDITLPGGLIYRNVDIDNQLSKGAFFDELNAAVIYSEEETSPITGNYADDFGGSGETLLSGHPLMNWNSTVQITVYAQKIKVAYQLGDMLIDHMSRNRGAFRSFALLDRHSAYNEELSAWSVVYKLRVQIRYSVV